MAILKNLPVLLPLVLSQVLTSNAHLAPWMPSLFGLDPTNINSDNASQPLQDYTFEQWWWHGNLDNPPADNESFALPANGQVDVEISSNKAFTTLGRGFKDANPRVAPDPWLNENGWGNMHAPARTDVAGSALAIAYKSDPRAVKPEDFVIFSVVHDSPARQLETYHVPDLPACPNDRCMCSWFWIHKSIGGTDQMYMAPFVCHVTGATNTQSLGKPVAPINCEGDTSKCIKGAKSPMYWKNLEGNNMFEPGHYAPTYNTGYGYFEGAQTDIFEDGHNQTSSAKAASVDNVPAAAIQADVTTSEVPTEVPTSSVVSTLSTVVVASTSAVATSDVAPVATDSASAAVPVSASASPSASATGRRGHIRGGRGWGWRNTGRN